MSGAIDPYEITPQLLLRAYSIGMFPMAEDANDPTLFWVDPEMRGVFPLDGLVVSRKLARLVRCDHYEVAVDRDFDAVIDACAGSGREDRPQTWINARIRRLYRDLFDRGFAHTVEVYGSNGLAGGLYGLAMGSAFFGESMFHRESDTSKVALVHLVGRLRAGGFRLLDAQYLTPHLASLGAIEIPRDTYHQRLDAAIGEPADFYVWKRGEPVSGSQALASAMAKITSP